MNIRVALVLALLGVSTLPSAHATPAKALLTGGAQESLTELLPARARAAIVVRKNAVAPIRDLMLSDVEMLKELQPYLVRTVGVDLTRIEAMAAFTLDLAAASPKVAVILRIPSQGPGPLKLPAAGDAGGTPLYRLDSGIVAARIKAGLVIGNEVEVRAAVAVDLGREPSLPRDAGLGKLLTASAGDIDFIAAIGPGALPPDKTMGVEDAVLFFQRSANTFELALHGDPSRLQSLKAMASGAAQMGIAALAQEKDKAVATNDPIKGATAIATYYHAKKLAAELDPKLEGNALKFRYKLPDDQHMSSPAMTVAIVGALAAIAVPNFQKYMSRSKASEAKVKLSMLVTQLRSLVSDGGKPLQSIRSTEWTPAKGCCGQPDNQCAPNTSSWSAPTWKALNFSVDEPSRYQYRVRVEGKGKTVKYIIEARGDLDCDNSYSSYKRTISADGTASDLETENELE